MAHSIHVLLDPAARPRPGLGAFTNGDSSFSFAGLLSIAVLLLPIAGLSILIVHVSPALLPLLHRRRSDEL